MSHMINVVVIMVNRMKDTLIFSTISRFIIIIV